MVIEDCHPRSAWELEPERISDLCFVPFFGFCPTCPGVSGFLSRPTCLPTVLAGGSTVNSSLQLQPNKSWSRIQVNHCRAAPPPSLADSESLRAAQPRLGRQAAPAWTPLAGSVSQPTRAFKDSLLRSQHAGKFELMSGPVMPWPEPGALRDPCRASDASQQCGERNSAVDTVVGLSPELQLWLVERPWGAIYLVFAIHITKEFTLVA